MHDECTPCLTLVLIIMLIYFIEKTSKWFISVFFNKDNIVTVKANNIRMLTNVFIIILLYIYSSSSEDFLLFPPLLGTLTPLLDCALIPSILVNCSIIGETERANTRRFKCINWIARFTISEMEWVLFGNFFFC